MQGYDIYSFDAFKILKLGRKDYKEKKIICNETISEACFYNHDMKMEKKADSQLFNQLKKMFNNSLAINELIITLDFKDFTSKQFELFSKFENGISLVINHKEITFVDFLKSNSMSKEARIYYFNNLYYQDVYKRLTLNMQLEKMNIAKWYAYSGLVISDCKIVDDIHLKKEEVVFIDDVIDYKKIDCVTAISSYYLLKFLDEKISEFNRYKINKEESFINFNNERIISFFSNILAICNSSDKEKLNKENKDDLILMDILANLNNFSLNMNLEELETISSYLNEKYPNIKSLTTIKWYYWTIKNYEVEINMFDGEGLISNEFAMEINSKIKNEDLNYVKENFINHRYGKSFQIRLPFIKGMVHAADIKQFFIDNNIKAIKGLYEDKLYDVNKIKMILTKSQLKAEKWLNDVFIKNKIETDKTPLDMYFRLLNEYDYSLGVKEEPPIKDKVHLNYQFLSTFPIKNSIQEWFDFNDKEFEIQTSRKAMLKNFKRSMNSEDDLDSYYAMDYQLYKNYSDFYEATDRYKQEKEKIIRSLIIDSAKGRLTVRGVRKYLSGDLYVLLFKACQIKTEEGTLLKPNNFYVPNTLINNERIKCVLLRNPHYSRSEIAILQLINDENRNKYFNYLQKVLFINSRSFVAERLGGADYDGDEVVVLTQETILNQIKSLLKKDEQATYLKYPPVYIPSLKASERNVNYKNKINCLKNSFINKIGDISNSAFFNTFISYDLEEEVDPIAFYTCLGGLEIDSIKSGIHPYIPEGMLENKRKNFGMYYKNSIEPKLKNDISKKEIKNILEKLEKEYKDYNNHPLYQCVKYYLNKNYKINNIDNKYIIEDNGLSTPEGIKNALIIMILDEEISKYLEYQKEKEKVLNLILLKIKAIRPAIFDNENIEDFLEQFKTDDPYKTLGIYECKDNNIPFHYLNNKEDKNNFLENILKINVSDKTKEYLFNFENGGYKLLFYALYYQLIKQELLKLKNTMILDNPSDYKHILIKQALDKANLTFEDIKDIVYKLRSKIILDPTLGFNSDKTNKAILKVIKENKIDQNINFIDVYKISANIFKNPCVFKYFKKETLEYLKERRDNE